MISTGMRIQFPVHMQMFRWCVQLQSMTEMSLLTLWLTVVQMRLYFHSVMQVLVRRPRKLDLVDSVTLKVGPFQFLAFAMLSLSCKMKMGIGR